ncbi:MBG domain-containing protein [Flavobacterium sp. LM5]|uniref:MBG domain-containing protein n=1 Tax=Flavobacterium sp. LM5 TaxID=1938610 RepID=UPI001670476A|nr:MBG domain-containing protein [Flavobacterium sp. LM5]
MKKYTLIQDFLAKTFLVVFAFFSMQMVAQTTAVSVFNYPGLNGSGSSCDNENANLIGIISAIPTYIVDASIKSFSDPVTLATQLSASEFFFMTDMETQSPSSTTFLPLASRDVIKNWVNNGGVMVMTGTFGSHDTNFLNLIFSWDLGTASGSSWAKNAVNTLGTPFENGPLSLPYESATDAISKGTVPNFKAMWGTDSNATVAVIKYGAGSVIFMGYDFFDAGPSCGNNSSPWVQGVIPSALNYAVELVGNSIIDFNNITTSYGSANFDLAASSNSGGNITYSILGTNTTGTTLSGTNNKTVTVGNTGSVVIRATQAADGAYTATTKDITLTISPVAITITADTKSKVYGDVDPALTYQLTSGALVAGDAFTGSLTRRVGEDVANYAIAAGTVSAGSNYTMSFVSSDLSITPKAIAITAEAKSKVYGDVDPALTYQLTSGALVPGDAFTGSLTRSVGEDVANYAIAAGTVSAGSNYTMSFVPSDLSITPKAIAITAEAKSKVYGDVDPALTYQATLVGTDFLTGSLTRAAGENVGSYAISSTLANSNYDITFVPANLAITKKSITVTADVKTKVYGDVDPALTYQATLLGTDVLTGSLTRAAGENVGSYAISSTLANSNYDITFVPANLAITKKSVTVTADVKTKVYGDVDPALTYQATLVGTDFLTGSLTRAAGENVGSYAISSTLANSNYDITFVPANLAITKKSVTVTADAKTKVYGDVDPALTYQATLVGTDVLTGSLTRAAGENVGSYVISSTLANSNYDITFVPDNLVITKKSVTVTADAKTKVYGDVDPALTYQLTSGALVAGDAFTGSLTRSVGENVANYAIAAGTVSAGSNYTMSFVSSDLSITPKAITITAEAKTKVYGDVDPALTYQLTSGALVAGDAFTGTLTRVTGENTGTYAIGQGNLNAGPNYAIKYNDAVFAINKANQIITWNQILESGCDGVTKITLTASTSSGLPLSFTPSNGNVASVLNGVLNFSNYGETTITVSQFGNNNYNAAQTIVLPALYTQPNLIRKHFDDVIFFDNSSKSYKSFTWYKNGEVVPSQTAQYFKENGVLNGVYYAKATKTDGTVVTSCSLTFSPSTEVEYLKIAPNPVKSNSEYQILTNIDSVKLKNARITVFNLLGVQIIDKEISEKTLDMIAPTTEGIYVVRLTLANGKYFTKNLLVRN